MKNLKSLSPTAVGASPFDKRETKKIYYSGFTLFELLITISIIGILVAIATISYSSAQKKGRDARRMQDMKNIQTAAEQYYSLNSSSYPVSVAAFPGALTGQSILQTWPVDPKGATYTQYAVSSATVTDYCVCALLETPAAGNSAATCDFVAAGYYCVKNQQ